MLTAKLFSFLKPLVVLTHIDIKILDLKLIFVYHFDEMEVLALLWYGLSVLIFPWGHLRKNRTYNEVSQQFEIFYMEYLFLIKHFM